MHWPVYYKNSIVVRNHRGYCMQTTKEAKRRKKELCFQLGGYVKCAARLNWLA